MELNGLTMIIFALFLVLEYSTTRRRGIVMNLFVPFLLVILVSFVFGYQFRDLSSSPWMSYAGVFVILYGFFLLIRRLNKRKRSRKD